MQGIRPRILIVEDDLLIALQMRVFLERCGCSPAGPVASVEEALQLVEGQRLDGAVLDVNLSGQWVWPLAEALEARSVPYVLVSGYSICNLPQRFRSLPYLAKPVSLPALRRSLAALGVAVSH